MRHTTHHGTIFADAFGAKSKSIGLRSLSQATVDVLNLLNDDRIFLHR